MLTILGKWKLILAAFLLLFNACGCNSSNEEQESPDRAIENGTILHPARALDIQADSTQFDSLSELISFFRRKYDCLELLKKRISRDAGLESRSTIAARDIQDSIYILTERRNNSIYQFLKAHEKSEDNFEGLKYIVVGNSVSLSKLEVLFREFPLQLRQSKYGKWLESQISKRRITESIASYDLAILNLDLYDPEGKPFKLKDIPANYILLDFWASWCAPCRYENRILVKRKALIEKNDFLIVGISLDHNKQKWLTASMEDELNYLNLCDYNAFDSPLAKEFKVAEIPHNVIIDKYGRIFRTNVWGEELTKYVKLLK